MPKNTLDRDIQEEFGVKYFCISWTVINSCIIFIPFVKMKLIHTGKRFFLVIMAMSI